MKTAVLLLLTALLLAGQAWAVERPAARPRSLPWVAAAPPGAGSLDQGLETLWEQAARELRGLIRQRIGGGVRLLLVLVLCGVGEGILLALRPSRPPPYVTLAGTAAIVLLAAGDLRGLMGLGVETIAELEQFSKALLPTLATAAAASGQVGAAAVKQVATVFFSDLLLTLIRRVLIPMTYFYIGLLAGNAVLGGETLSKLADALKDLTTWCLKTALVLFTSYLAVAGTAAGAADAAALKAAQSAISGAVPVVGNVISNVAETVLAGAAVLRNSIGVFGVLGILAIGLLPFLRLAVQYLLYKGVALVASTLGNKPLVELLEGLGSAFGLILGMTGSAALLLLISVISSLLAVTA